MPIRSYSIVNNIQDSEVYLPIVDITNTQIYSILDTIIALNNKCIHVTMGELTWFNIWGKGGDTLKVYITANQYVNSSVSRIQKKDYGIFYYKKFLFVVSNSNGLLDAFFSKTETEEKVITYYPNVVNYLFKNCKKCYSYYQGSTLSSYYISNRFIITNTNSDCIEYYPVYHKIRRGDTVEKLSKLYWVNPEQIMRLNNLTEPVLPAKGEIKIQ